MNPLLHTDIVEKKWIARLPVRVRPFAVLARLDRPVGVWLLFLPGAWSLVLAAGGVRGMDGAAWRALVLFGLGAVVMRAAGCVVNDLWDKDLDAKVTRTRLRPLASGVISPRAALVFLAGLLGVGLVILLHFNTPTIVLGVASLPLIALYPLMKRWTWWPQAFLGLTFNFGALMGWAALRGTIDFPAITLYIAGIFWTLGYDTIYAHQDREDDALAGIRSTALRLGAHSRRWICGFYGAALALLCLAGTTQNSAFLLFLTPALAHAFWQMKIWNPDDPASSLHVFRSNIVFGLLVLGAVAAT
ncbi:MAG: 4-hydroxybenzoate octaprenyltransferase [Rhodospirillales bacterium]|nr:4-hydroxybenzoate octaprenyltransferase [Rhodospirillales bacterium]